MQTENLICSGIPKRYTVTKIKNNNGDNIIRKGTGDST